MGDYPDYTSLMQIIGTDITLPIDIKAVTVAHIDVDIAAQSVGNIAVAIAASTVTLNVAIASSAVTLNVDVKAQTLTDFKITVNAQNVGVYLQPEWAALQGIDKNFIGIATNKAWEESVEVTYTVPAGKTLYITSVGGSSYASAQANADLNQICRIGLAFGIITLCQLGGNSGCGLTFSKPYSIAGGQTMSLWIVNEANHITNLRVFANGYEV